MRCYMNHSNKINEKMLCGEQSVTSDEDEYVTDGIWTYAIWA
jgi:hypothetical protein